MQPCQKGNPRRGYIPQALAPALFVLTILYLSDCHSIVTVFSISHEENNSSVQGHLDLYSNFVLFFLLFFFFFPMAYFGLKSIASKLESHSRLTGIERVLQLCIKKSRTYKNHIAYSLSFFSLRAVAPTDKPTHDR